ncbi:error-prone DNA polymerase [Methylocystis sp. 9N]|uniref:Error-prone DNA polymerase n=1 Tax=Methylocystis borbori TaxID=3118750 RepID=A0ABU7XFP5_9HYPH
MSAPFAELVAMTNFSFLRGASHPGEMVLTALLLGQNGIGIADRNSVAGVVRAYAALKELRENLRDPPADFDAALRAQFDIARVDAFKLVVGARLVFADAMPDVIVHPQNRNGWARLTRLLTTGNLRAKKGQCHLYFDDLAQAAGDLLLIVMPPRELALLPSMLARLRDIAKGDVWLGAAMPRRGDDRRRLAKLKEIAARAGTPLIATNDALYADPRQRDLQDVVTCIREGVTLARAGRRLEVNAERHLKAPGEMARLFTDAPEAIEETQNFLARVDFSLGQLQYEYPDEPIPPGRNAQEWLDELTWRHAAMRYPQGVPEKVDKLLRDELSLIEKLDYARYFLTIHDIVRVAQDKGILCQGRGSAANSAVCYALGVTCVDPAEHDLLFARFISQERKEPPDIDVDFEHERREEIIQHIYEKYGRARAGLVATVISYRPRSAIREVGKVFGLTEDVTAALAHTQWGSGGSKIPDAHIRQAGLDPENPVIRRAIDFAKRLLGFPRHLSQHVGGFVLARGRLDELTPIANAAMPERTFIEWDKDDIDALGLMKVDVLALGMLTCIRKAFDELRAHEGVDLGLADVPQADAPTYEMLCKGDSLGVFQVESRAQMNMLPRLKPRAFYDLVIQVAIVRPGPIQGDMVHPYLRRRAGIEPVTYPSPAPEHGPKDELRAVLEKTMGVPLFQEQAMKLAMVAAEFSEVEANRLRRAMATFRNVGTIHLFESMMVERMAARGYDRAFAQSCFNQIKGFGSYGFPESHAASFAKLVYVSSWIKRHHPAIFTCALLNSQPMGFYAPAQIVRDARDHGVDVRAVDVNFSDWDNRLERAEDGALALRLGFRQADGLHEDAGRRIAAARGDAPYESVEELARRAALNTATLRALADSDAFRSLKSDRRQALWDVRRLPDAKPLPLFAAAEARELAAEPDPLLPAMSLGEHVAADYQTLRLSLKAHPMAVLRPIFARERIKTCAETNALADGAWARAAGVVLVRQRPGQGNAIFVTLEDETGVLNLVIWARLFERYRRETMAARLMLAEGRVQKSPENVVHLMALRIIDRSGDLNSLSDGHRPDLALSRADEFAHPQSARVHPRNIRVLPKSRDFH